MSTPQFQVTPTLRREGIAANSLDFFAIALVVRRGRCKRDVVDVFLFWVDGSLLSFLFALHR